jgi:hypothetical protein
MSTGSTKLPADPIIVFLAGAFVGVTVGPQVVKVARETFEARSGELVSVALDQLITSLKQRSVQ